MIKQALPETVTIHTKAKLSKAVALHNYHSTVNYINNFNSTLLLNNTPIIAILCLLDINKYS